MSECKHEWENKWIPTEIGEVMIHLCRLCEEPYENVLEQQLATVTQERDEANNKPAKMFNVGREVMDVAHEAIDIEFENGQLRQQVERLQSENDTLQLDLAGYRDQVRFITGQRYGREYELVKPEVLRGLQREIAELRRGEGHAE